MSLLDLPFIGLALIFRTVAFEPFYAPASSMAPTIEVGDRFWVSKSEYGYSTFSVPYGRLLPTATLYRTQPKRGDVVVFRLPSDTSVDYVKRVIGLSGDRVRMRDGIVILNGKSLPRVADGAYPDKSDATAEAAIFRETIAPGRSYRVAELADGTMSDNTEEFVVPEGHLFVLGDNRDNSNDSRFDVGFVPEANLVGRVVFKLDLSGSRIKLLSVD